MNQSPDRHPTFELRPVTAADETFVFQLYAGTRTAELALTGWPPAQQEAFLRSQFAARESSYRTSFPDAQHSIVLQRRAAVGALIVHRASHEIRLVSFVLVPERRGAGLGTRLVQTLIDEARATHRPLRLHVLKDDAAARLYTRLGFAPIGENGLYLKMEWREPAA